MSATVRTTRTLTLQGAEVALRGAVDASVARGICVSVAVTDAAGHLLAFVRMDDAPILTVRLAQEKAQTATQFGVATHDWYGLIKDDPALLAGMPQVPGLVIFGGGLPVRDEDGTLLGGLGVSGGSTTDDVSIATAGLSALRGI